MSMKKNRDNYWIEQITTFLYFLVNNYWIGQITNFLVFMVVLWFALTCHFPPYHHGL